MTVKKKAPVKKKTAKKKVVRKKVTTKKVTKKTARVPRTWPVNGKPMTREQVQQFVCDKLASSSLGVKTMCDTIEGMPKPGVIYRWLSSNDEFRDKYARARSEQADYMADEILKICDDSENDYMEAKHGSDFGKSNPENVNRARLRVDTRKWLMSKLQPKKYGDKMDVTVRDDKYEGKSLEELQAIAAEYASRK